MKKKQSAKVKPSKISKKNRRILRRQKEQAADIVRRNSDSEPKPQSMIITPDPVIEVHDYLNAGWGTYVNGEKCFPLHEAQSDILRSKSRFCLASAGTGGGKTAVGPLWLMDLIHQYPGEIWLVVAPTYQIMSRATAPTLINTFAGTDFEGRWLESKNRYYLPDGGIIYFVSADNPNALEGGQFRAAWVDEGGQLKYGAWVAIQGRVGLHQGRVLITTTPYELNWLYHEVVKRFMAGDKNYYVKYWSSYNNPAYTKEEYDRAKGSMSTDRAAMRYDGLFCKMSGLVYPDMETCFIPYQDPPEGRLIGGIDFGWAQPFAGLAATHYIEDETGKDIIYVWYERYKRRTSLESHAKSLPDGVFYQADPSRPDSIYELKKAGLAVKGAYNDIMVGIDAVNSRIYNGTLKIADSCKALKAEMEEYRFPEEEDRVKGDKPIDEFNHACDALRYLVMGIDRRKVARRSA